LAIPDRIGQVPPEATSDSLRFQLARTQAAPASQGDWSSSDTTNTVSASPRYADRSAAHNADASGFPKRGFSPPLERPDPPPAPAPVAPPTPPTPPPLQLNITPPAPPPAEQPPAAASPPQPEVAPQAQAVPPQAQAVPPQAQAVPPPPDAPASPAPAPN
jgi:hypothetical protein